MGIHARRIACLLTATAWLLWEYSIANAQEPPTLDQIIEGIGRSERLLFENQSMLLRFARTQCEDVAPGAATGHSLPVEWRDAYRAGKWFCERRFTEPKRTNRLTVPAEPKTMVISDRFVVDWNQFTREAYVDIVETDYGRNIYAGFDYTRNLSLDVAKYVAKSNGTSLAEVRKKYTDEAGLPFLPDYLREHLDRYHVCIAPEEVDGAMCWVVEWPEMDRFWVDPARGYAIVRRRFAWEPGKPWHFEFHNRDYREVKPGLWLPEAQTEDRYASIAFDRRQLWGQIISRSQFRLLDVQFNNVPEALFDIRLPPGTVVCDLYRKIHYLVPNGSGEPFAETIALAKAGHGSRNYWLWVVLPLALAVALGSAAWLSIYRRRFAKAA
jgi:hypothetical protein